jgi:hypothetical protein
LKKFLFVFSFITILILLNIKQGFSSDKLASKANLRFSHKTHELKSVACNQCHINRESSQSEPAPGLPPGWQMLKPTPILATESTQNIFRQNHDIDDSFGRPGEARCLKCHFGSREKSDCALCHLGNPGYTDRERDRFEKPFFFSHETHEQSDCSRCHGAITNWETLDGHKISNRMEDCLECHNGAEVSKNCVMCHSPTPRPADHTRNYQKKHGTAYRADPMSCNMCHEQSSCIKCHSQKPGSHTLAWVRHRHGITARTNPLKCQACHSDPWVCSRCHNDSDIPW